MFGLGFLWAAVGAATEHMARDGGTRLGVHAQHAPFIRNTATSKRLKTMWAFLALSQFLVLEMSMDMQNPYHGQYRVDEYGVLASVFEGPMRSRLDRALNR
mmetsp:Transcript_38125/g.69012  ORF Transcript_38125/g.69012 Transcript_38125/m.69012 type:complete len:101 (-) Transcript_38125:24-326(-)